MRDKVYMPQGLVVEVINGDVERALRKLKKKAQNEGIFQELKKREFYVKPSELRRRQKAQARARARKKQRMDDNSNKDFKLDRPEY
jgi:small subunit ribosomal protein S21